MAAGEARADRALAGIGIADRQLAARRAVGGVFLDRRVLGIARGDRRCVVGPGDRHSQRAIGRIGDGA